MLMFFQEKIDLDNVKKLKNFSQTDVVMSFKDLEKKVIRRNNSV